MREYTTARPVEDLDDERPAISAISRRYLGDYTDLIEGAEPRGERCEVAVEREIVVDQGIDQLAEDDEWRVITWS